MTILRPYRPPTCGNTSTHWCADAEMSQDVQAARALGTGARTVGGLRYRVLARRVRRHHATGKRRSRDGPPDVGHRSRSCLKMSGLVLRCPAVQALDAERLRDQGRVLCVWRVVQVA